MNRGISIFFGRIVDLTQGFDAPQFAMIGVLFIGALIWIRIDVSKMDRSYQGSSTKHVKSVVNWFQFCTIRFTNKYEAFKSMDLKAFVF